MMSLANQTARRRLHATSKQLSPANPAGISLLDGNQRSLQLPNLKVLLAEDNIINQKITTHILKLENIFDVVVAGDGVQAVDKVRETIYADSSFSLIFMDISMPNMDGIEATKRIRELDFTGPIIALSVSDDVNLRNVCFQAGMDDIWRKPHKRTELQRLLEKIFPKEDIEVR